MSDSRPVVMAGIPAVNNSLYHRMRFLVGDPVALVTWPADDGAATTTLIIRDIELERARAHARADEIACPADYAPASGLSGDRESATAQALAECVRRRDVRAVIADRTLPLIFAHELRAAGIDVTCDPSLGVLERRAKDDEEVAHLRDAQRMTESAMAMACGLIAGATAAADGTLQHDGAVLTSERVRAAIDVFLLERGYANPECIVAGGAHGGDCHERGTGELRTEQPVIIDIFPRNRQTLYNGDCTRTVVHGAIPEVVARMHQAVIDAKAAAIAATRAGTTGDAIHAATRAVIEAAGFEMGLPGPDDPPTRIAMAHGTGHGVGLDVHEPPLLDVNGPEIVAGDVLTIEPGLYAPAIGGIRVEDMVVARADGCENLNVLPEGLTWA